MADAIATPDQGAYLEMSDEDFLKAPTPSIPAQPEAEATPATPVVEAPVEEEDTPEEPDEDDAPVTPAPEGDDDTKAGEAADRQGGKAEPDAGDEKPEGEKTPVKDEPSPTEKPAPVETVDYEKAYKELMTPFKANGREIQVKSIDDVRTLMQMGANYNKKMAAMKPHLKVIKMLENNGLLDEGKLSFLIDLDKKNPEAISKLVTEAGVDPMDIDADKAKGYKSGTYSVSDKEVELDNVLNELESTPTYQRTLSIVGKEWDQTSRNAIAEVPELLKLINTHVERGIYDIISAEIESERSLGRLKGLSDFEAYRQVGDVINARGGFDHLASTEVKGHQNPNKQGVTVPNPKKVDDDKLKDKRRAASTSRPAAVSGKASDDFNPLAMSDEEYAKLSAKAHLM